MFKLGVMVSGGGTNLQAIIDKIKSGYLEGCSIATVVSSRKDAYALERAKQNDIPAVCISKKLRLGRRLRQGAYRTFRTL